MMMMMMMVMTTTTTTMMILLQDFKELIFIWRSKHGNCFKVVTDAI
jgi:hypothetical protein